MEDGLPEAKSGKSASSAFNAFFQPDDYQSPGISMGRLADLKPGFEEKTLEDKGDHLIIQDKTGVIYEKMKPDE